MQGRIEYKFLAPSVVVDRLRADMLPYVVPDPQPGANGPGIYTVRSVYYDTPRFDCYEAKLAGLRIRRKFRIRGYDQRRDDSVVFLEIKKKHADFIDKHRSPLLARHLADLLATRDIERYILDGGGSARAKRDAERFLYHYYRHRLAPSALVVYDREAYFGKYDPSLRITFDLALRTTLRPAIEALYEDTLLQPAMNGAFVFEVKFHRNALPAWVRSIVSRYRLPRMSLSKYTICMDSETTARHTAVHFGSPFARALKAASIQERPAC